MLRYHRIYLVLRQKILNGVYDVSGLPPEFGLMEQYRVARVTVRRALAELQGRADLSAAGAGDLRHAAGGMKSLGGARLEAVLGDAESQPKSRR
jgi:DNA-binding transcriptional MocR family regulator